MIIFFPTSALIGGFRLIFLYFFIFFEPPDGLGQQTWSLVLELLSLKITNLTYLLPRGGGPFVGSIFGRRKH